MAQARADDRALTSGPDTARFGALIPNVAGWVAVWLIVAVAAAILTADFGRRLGPYRTGLITLVLLAGLGLYSARKRQLWISLRILRLTSRLPPSIQSRLIFLDRLETWRAVHLAVGAIALVPFWWHLGSGLMGPLEALLAAAVVLLVLSGLGGAAIQQYLPHAMTLRAEHEVRLRDAEAKVKMLYIEAEEKILGHSEALVRAYLQAIKPILIGSQPRRLMLRATLMGFDPAERACSAAVGYESRLSDEAQVYRELLSIAARKVNLEHNAFNLRLSTGWLAFHIVLAAVTGVLVFFHVVSVLYFAGT